MEGNFGDRVRGVRGRGGQGRGQNGREAQQGRGVKHERGQRRTITNEIKANFRDHVFTHSFSFRDAGQRVQPTLSCYTVATIIRTFQNENRQVNIQFIQ